MDLIKANINNLTGLWSLAGRLDGQFLSSEEYAISTVAESEWPNKMWFHLPPTKKILEKTYRAWNSKGIGVALWYPDITKELLESHGLTLKNELTGMSMQLNGSIDHNQRLTYRRVTDAGLAALWSSLFLKAFGYWINPSTVERTMDKVDYLIGNKGQEAIGTAVLFKESPAVAGIHSIGVVPEHRRKGYAADLLNHVLGLAEKEGACFVTLQASSMAKGLYLKTGFQEDFLLKTFVKS